MLRTGAVARGCGARRVGLRRPSEGGESGGDVLGLGAALRRDAEAGEPHAPLREEGADLALVRVSRDDVGRVERRRGEQLGVERVRPADRWEIGVQWHPEKMSESTSAALFRAFVDECRARGAA